MSVVGLDIGGANLKAVHVNGFARSQAFPLWKQPERLAHALHTLLLPFPAFDALAVTMTGELCDCFATKREGVAEILDAVQHLARDQLSVGVWSTANRFLSPSEARQHPREVAAANWHALATWCQTLVPGPGLLLDIGSTTTDLIPFDSTGPHPRGLTDPERLRFGELVYTGVRRTPVCALLGPQVAAEWFATTLDVYLTLGDLAEEPENCDTADGRPATRSAARNRLAHQVCADGETFSADEAVTWAQRAATVQEGWIESALRSLPTIPQTVVLSGSGEFLARRIVARVLPTVPRISVADQLGAGRSEAACAYAVAWLGRSLGRGQ